MLLITSMIIILTILFMMMNHPVSLMMIIFLQTMLISLLCGLMSNLWWFSYMLFLTMIGGLLVLFMYMTNVASNEKFNMNFFWWSWMIPLSILITTFLQEYFKFKNQISWWKGFMDITMETILMKYYNYPTNFILIMMMVYLLITMIMSVKITDKKKGALRQKN